MAKSISQEFIKGLLILINDYRGVLNRIQFKVFLREDIYLSIEDLQNKSHLEAFKKDLKFQSRDLWRLALNLITKSSDTFKQYANQNAPQGSSTSWDLDEEKLKKILEPLWGRTLEKGKAAISTNYIMKRTSDSQGRFFPRTFVQMLKQAFEVGKKSPPPKDRILSHQALRSGVESASNQRTTDLTTEYIEFKPYFDSMKGMRAIFTMEDFKKKMDQRNTSEKGISKRRSISNLLRVLQKLENIGVLNRIPNADDSWSVALMYRMGLGVVSSGIT